MSNCSLGESRDKFQRLVSLAPKLMISAKTCKCQHQLLRSDNLSKSWVIFFEQEIYCWKAYSSPEGKLLVTRFSWSRPFQVADSWHILSQWLLNKAFICLGSPKRTQCSVCAQVQKKWRPLLRHLTCYRSVDEFWTLKRKKPNRKFLF